jgi:hypothetical protein
MVDLDYFNDITSDQFIVRTKTDESGDYKVYSYDIIAKTGFGQRVIVEGIENPHDAAMFAYAPDLIKEIIELRKKLAEFEEHRKIILDIISGNYHDKVKS